MPDGTLVMIEHPLGIRKSNTEMVWSTCTLSKLILTKWMIDHPNRTPMLLAVVDHRYASLRQH